MPSAAGIRNEGTHNAVLWSNVPLGILFHLLLRRIVHRKYSFHTSPHILKRNVVFSGSLSEYLAINGFSFSVYWPVASKNAAWSAISIWFMFMRRTVFMMSTASCVPMVIPDRFVWVSGVDFGFGFGRIDI